MNDTITVRRGNVVLDISPEQKEQYLASGYSVIDNTGVVIEKAVLNTVPALQEAVKELTAENEKLKAEIAKLKTVTKKTNKNSNE